MRTSIDFIDAIPFGHIALLSNLQDGEARGNVIVVPPFGKTAKDLFVFAHYLWSAGWNVFRFDARNHVGFSSGDIVDFTLSSLLCDLDVVSATLAGRGFARPVLFGISLSVPVLLKYAASNTRIRGLVSVVGAVDVAFAIEQASGDVVAQYRQAWPDRKPYQTMLGYDVRAENFVLDMDRAGFAPLEALVADTGAAPCAIHMIMADQDAWVEPASAIAVHEAAPPGSTLTRFEGLTHEFGRSIRMAKAICLEVCRLCNLIAGDDAPPAAVPDFATILRTSSAEAADLDVVSRKGHVSRQPIPAA
jgi:hypothetical protein